MRYEKIGSLLLFLFSLGLAFAQDPSIQAVVSSNQIATNQRFNYEIVTNSNCLITPPQFKDFQIVGGPSQSRSSSVEIVNGVQTRNVQFRVIYQLVARKEGSFKIEAASMECNGDVYKTEPITITVSKGQTNSGVDKDFYMRLTSNKSSVYEGEPFVATLKVYSKVRPESIEGLDLGDASGIWRQDLKPDRQTFTTNEEMVNGMRRYSIVLREELCFAQRNGTVNLEPYHTVMTFSQGFFNRYRKEAYSNTLEVDVKKIPGSDSPNFNGLVGDFSVSATLSKSDVEIGEAIDLKLKVEGKGNLQALGDIELDFPNDFDQFDPEVKEKTNVSSSGLKGSIEYNYVLIPTHYGEYVIPAYTFDYFDLEEKKMKTVSTGDFVINVEKPEGAIDVEEKPITVEEQDIHYIDQEIDELFKTDDFLFGSFAYLLLLVSPVLMAILFVLFRRKQENLSDEDKLKVVQKKAVKVAQLSIANAKAQMEQGENSAALKTLQATLNTFFKQKFNVGLSDLSKRSISDKLKTAEVEATTIDAFNRVWNTIEMGQYAPISTANLAQTANDVEELIINLDKKL